MPADKARLPYITRSSFLVPHSPDKARLVPTS